MSTIKSVVNRRGAADHGRTGAAIEADGLTKRYGEVAAVAGVSFAVAPGEIFGYLGRNGSGKTTTVRMLTTLTRPTSGRALVGGVAVEEANRVRELIGVTMQDAALDDAMTAVDHLRLIAGLSGLRRAAARARAGAVLELLGLEHVATARIATYSGGMKRRLDIATALIGQPSILFLDEPTTGLDPQSRRAVWDEIRALRATGVTVFLTTQYLEEADQLADRVAIIDRGALIAEDTPSRLKAGYGRTTITLTGGADPGQIDGLLQGLDTSAERDESGRSVITLAPGSDGRAALDVLDRLRIGGISPTHLTVTETSLEDVFVRLTGSAINGSSSEDRGA